MRRISALLAALTAAALLLPIVAAGTVEPAEQAQAYVLMEIASRTVLESKNADIPMNCGYLTKLMVLLAVAEDIDSGRYSLTDEITAGESVRGTKGAVVWLEAGDKMTVEELLKSVIIGNANDAVTVLAEHSEESVEAFTARMNSMAFDLGLRNTAFYSPWGYPDSREHTTAHDMAVICAELAGYDFLRPYFKTWRDFVRSGKTELVNENTLARTYDLHIGFKASHSDEAGYCCAEGAVNDAGVGYIAVVLGAPDEEVSLGGAKKLIKSGFSGYKVTATMFPDEMMRPVKVRGGVDISAAIRIREQSSLVVPKGVGELSTVVVLPSYMDAPVICGQRVGTAAFYSGKNLICETDIVAAEDVEELTLRRCVEKTVLNMLK